MGFTCVPCTLGYSPNPRVLSYSPMGWTGLSWGLLSLPHSTPKSWCPILQFHGTVHKILMCPPFMQTNFLYRPTVQLPLIASSVIINIGYRLISMCNKQQRLYYWYAINVEVICDNQHTALMNALNTTCAFKESMWYMSIKTITLVFPLLLHHLFPQGEVTFVEMGQVDLHASAHTLSPVMKH